MRRSGKASAAAAINVIGLGLLGCAAVSGTGWFPTEGAEDATRAGLLGIAIICLLAGFILLTTEQQSNMQSGSSVQQPMLDGWIFDLEKEITKLQFEHDSGTVLSFIEFITQPARFRSRVVETIELERMSIQQHVSVEFSMPSYFSQSKTLYLPILMPRKGELLNNFKLTDADDTTITNLSYEETTKLIAVALRALLVVVTEQQYGLWPNETHEAEFIFLKLITNRGPVNGDLQDGPLTDAINRLGGKITEESESLIATYVNTLSATYPVVAAVARETVIANRILLKYERSILPTASKGRLTGSVRLGFRLKPREVSVPLSLALTAASFHLRINAPAEKYLYSQNIRCCACKKRLTLQWRGTNPNNGCYHRTVTDSIEDCHYHVQPRRGQNYLHLYMRGYGSSGKPLRNLEAMAVFKEMPPGTRAAAAVTALATSVFIWTAGYLISHNAIIGNSDLPALLLSVPAIGASYFGFTADSDIVGSSLLARISLVLSGLLAVSSIVAYILEVPGINPSSNHGHMISGLAFAGLSTPTWIILFILSTMNFIYIWWRFMRKLHYYAKLVNKSAVTDEGFSSR